MNPGSYTPRLMTPSDPVYLIKHVPTNTLFGIHKIDNRRHSMSFVTGFANEETCKNILNRLEAYHRSSGTWPNRILDDRKAYLWELHEDDDIDEKSNSTCLEMITSTFGHLQAVLHNRRIAMETVFELNLRPHFSATITVSPPRTDFSHYTDQLEYAYNLTKSNADINQIPE